MTTEFTTDWSSAEELVVTNSAYIKKFIDKNNVDTAEFTSIKVGDNPYDMTCKWKGTKFSKLDILVSKVRDNYPGLSTTDVKLLLMAVGVKQIKTKSTVMVRTFSSPQEFSRNELMSFHPVECTTDMWDCDGDIPVSYKPYLSGLKRPWTLEQIKGAMAQELDKYNRTLPKDFSHAKIGKDTFDIGFSMALQEYYNKFDDEIKQSIKYDGSDPVKAIGFLIDALAITGNRDLQIAKVWQYCVNVKRTLFFQEYGIKRRWHVVPTVVGRGGTGKTETFQHFLVRPLRGRGTATRFSSLADTRWTRAFAKYYAAIMDDLGYEDFTANKEGIVKQIITCDKTLDRSLGSNKDDSFSNIYLQLSMCASSNYHIADLTNDDALLRRLVELPSAKTGRGDITPVLHLDPCMIFRSIDESQLDTDPLMTDEIRPLWEKDKAEARQHHWIYRGLRQLGYLPPDINTAYEIKDGDVVALRDLQESLAKYYRAEHGRSPSHNVKLEQKLQDIGIQIVNDEMNNKTVTLLKPFDMRMLKQFEKQPVARLF